MDKQSAIQFIIRIYPGAKHWHEDEILRAFEIYEDYRSEGQSHIVSKQYAGLL